METTPTSAAAYDRTPYPSYAYPRSSPTRIAAVATLFGMSPPQVPTARVLEIGSGMGGNLLPLAARFPRARFVGVDYSAVQVARATADAAALKLGNVRFDDRSILDIGDAELGEFDYVIAHGLYSWVPEPVRERIVALIGKLLSPNGVAYLSYNARPGWDAIRPLRDGMLYRIRDIDDDAEKVATARRFARFMAEHTEASDSPVRGVLLREVARIERAHDAFLLHDYLEATNDAFYLSDVVAHAARHGLQYLGDATLYSMPVETPSPENRTRIARVGACDDLPKLEQYRDFLTNRRFRMTLLCRSGVQTARRVKPDNLARLRLVTACRPPKPVPERLIGRLRQLPLDYRGEPHGTVSGPVLVTAMLALIAAGPGGLPCRELIARTAAGARVPRDQAEREISAAAGDLLAKRFIDVELLAPDYALAPPPRPIGFLPARLAATRGEIVPNMRHQSVGLDAAQRSMLARLDGSLGRARLADAFPGMPNPEAVLASLVEMALIAG